jgi:hypothetical protein
MTTEYYVKADRRAAEAARESMEQQGVRWLKPDVGSTYMRILPPHPAMRNPETGAAPFYWHVSLHFGVGPQKRVVVCPRRQTAGALHCPICEYAFGLKDAGHDKAGNDLLPSWQAYMNVLVIDPETGEPKRNKAGEVEVLVWSCGRGTLDKLFAKIERHEKKVKRTIDITDPDEGYVIELTREGKTRDDTKYDVFLADAPTSVSEYVEEWGPALYDLTRLNTLQPATELKALLTGEEDPFTVQQKALPSTRLTFSRNDDEAPVEGEFVPFDEGTESEAAESTRPDAAERLKKLIKGS